VEHGRGILVSLRRHRGRLLDAALAEQHRDERNRGLVGVFAEQPFVHLDGVVQSAGARQRHRLDPQVLRPRAPRAAEALLEVRRSGRIPVWSGTTPARA
jgi:hypothetical protein